MSINSEISAAMMQATMMVMFAPLCVHVRLAPVRLLSRALVHWITWRGSFEPLPWHCLCLELSHSVAQLRCRLIRCGSFCNCPFKSFDLYAHGIRLGCVALAKRGIVSNEVRCLSTEPVQSFFENVQLCRGAWCWGHVANSLGMSTASPSLLAT